MKDEARSGNVGNGLAIIAVFLVFMSAGVILLAPRIFASAKEVNWANAAETAFIVPSGQPASNTPPQLPPNTVCMLHALREAGIGVALGVTAVDAVQVVVAANCGFAPDGEALAKEPEGVVKHTGQSNGSSPTIVDNLNTGRPAHPSFKFLDEGKFEELPQGLFAHEGKIYPMRVVQNDVGEYGIVKVFHPDNANEVVAEIQFARIVDDQYGEVVISFINNYRGIPGFGARLSQVEDHILYYWSSQKGRPYTRLFVLATDSSQSRYGQSFLEACGCDHFYEPHIAEKTIGHPYGLIRSSMP